MYRRVLRILPPTVLLTLLMVTVVLAIVSYSAPLTITESNSNDYTMLAVFDTVDNQWLADNNFMLATALDTRVETLGGLAKPHMVVDDRTLTAVAVPADSQTNLRFTTNNTALSAMDIITGYGGYVTVTDVPALEPGSNFEIEADGYFDASAGANKDIVYKQDAFDLYISGANTVTADATFGGSTSLYSSTSDGMVFSTNAVYATAHDSATGTVNSAGTTVFLGQRFSAGNYLVYRDAYYFDTSGIPAAATVTAATLYLYGNSDSSTADFDITIQNGQPTYPHDPLVTGDYLYTHYSGDGGSMNTAAFAVGSYNAITLNADGRSWINCGGATKLAVLSSEDIADSPPAGDEYVSVYNSDQAGTDKDPYISITYTVDSSLTSALTTGEHTVKVTADGADIKLYVDSVEKDTDSITGSVVDNANDWIIARNNVMPYMDYCKYTISGTLTVHFEPITMIIGTALPDRAGAAQNGAITWGANPAGVSVSIDSLEVEGAIDTGDTIEGEAVDVLPEVVVSDFYVDPAVSGALLTNPLRPLVTMLSDSTTMSESQAWRLLGLALILAVTVITMLAVGRHQGITMIAAGAALLGTVVLTIFPMWMLVFCVGMFIGGLVMERAPSL